ncbi:hypothetical protein MANES_02G104000v8 [Manihot esculenta]|uniref:Uncharacterized protein n=1 Tax=Manihot esculenta TaxID=3983 RepID=A0ACB7I827_MANES|nr:hypothetical protein MANES_02G104000v8 [Manihot esculenta]
MEKKQQQQNQQLQNEDSNSGVKGSFLCRQSSTRWTPTTDQIRILKDLYYNSGVRSPSAEQIQKISARLRQYGKIEGKNVFYWFQNHKARERQKKRFTTDVPMQQRTVSNASNWKPEDYPFHNKYPNTTSGFSSSSPSSAGGSTVGQMGNYGYRSVTIENSFRDCLIPAGANSGVVGSMSPSYGWVGIDTYSSAYSHFDKRKSSNEILEGEEREVQEEEAITQEIETLPLFPTQREDTNGILCNLKHNPICYPHNYWYGSDDGNNTSRTFLELSLNSYGNGQAPDSI